MNVIFAHPFGRIFAYLIASYVFAVAVMALQGWRKPLIIGAVVWILPAIIAVANRNEDSLVGQFRGAGICLIVSIVLVWAAVTVFVMTY